LIGKTLKFRTIFTCKHHNLDRAILRECLREAKRLQQRVKLNYAL
jgi:hypothetical protein